MSDPNSDALPLGYTPIKAKVGFEPTTCGTGLVNLLASSQPHPGMAVVY